MLFLAADVGYSLYKPDRIASGLPVCTLETISGTILVMKTDSMSWEQAAYGMELDPGSRIRTADNAHAVLNFIEGTTTKLEPGTDVIIQKLEAIDGTQTDTIVLKQQAGKTWNQVAKASDSCDFQIQTASADIMVHGTLFAAEVDETGQTTVETTEGRVSVAAENEEVQVPAGKMTVVSSGEAPSEPVEIPPATNELVFTVDSEKGAMVTDPSGSRTGVLENGVPVNEISGSRVTDEGDGQTIRIREPGMGDYSVSLNDDTDTKGSFSVEGFIQGQRAFVHSNSGNATGANGLLLKLHCEVIEGVFQGASVLSLKSSEKDQVVLAMASPTPVGETVVPAEKPASPDAALPENKEPSGSEQLWFSTEGHSNMIQWISMGSIIALMGTIYLIILKKN